MVKLLLALTAFLPCVLMAASNQAVVYQGRVTRPDGSLPNAGTITFSLSLYSPSPNRCLLYSETQVVNMTGSQGMFSVELGSGTRVDGGAHPFAKAFVNGATLAGLTCDSGSSYTSAATDDRTLEVSINDAGTVAAFAPIAIKSAPFAMQAHEIDGWGLNNLVKVSTVGSPSTFTTSEMANVKSLGAASCSINEILKWNGSSWACGVDATGGASDASYSAKGVVQLNTDAATSGLSISNGVMSVNTGTGANQILKLDSSSRIPAVDGSQLTHLSASNFSAAVPISKGGTGQTTSIAGFNALSPLTTKGDLITFDGTNNIRLPVGLDGYVLKSDSSQSSGLKWAAPAIGTVTRVGLSLPSEFDVTSSSVTDNGTLAATWGDQPAWTVLAGPTGAGGRPTFRALTSADLPSFDASKITSGTLPVSLGGTGSNDGSIYATGALKLAAGGSNQNIALVPSGSGNVNVSSTGIHFASGSGNASNPTPPTGSFNGIYSNNDNRLDFATNGITRFSILASGNVVMGNRTTNVIGNNFLDWYSNSNGFAMDEYGVYIKTLGSVRLTMDNSGKIGIGTAGSARTTLDVNGTIIGRAAQNISGATVDFGLSNFAYTTQDCGTYSLQNLKDGGSYTFVVQGSTGATCTFNVYSDKGTTVLVPHFTPTNGATIPAKHTEYNIKVLGAHAYIHWTSGL